jgi:hypothetical protein
LQISVITIPTVFVLGAGASCPFGFPTGQGLRQIVLERLGYHESPFYKVLTDLDHTDNELFSFRKELTQCGRLSVDAFLEYRPDLVQLGKRCIALALIEHEIKERLFNNHGDWYQWVFQAMDTSFESFGENRVSFVTFNYDRSLEQYLSIVLQSLYKRTIDDVAPVLGKVKIVHVHGQLGPLPWEGGRYRVYKDLQNIEVAKIAAEGIRIPSEDAPGEAEEAFTLASGLLREAKRVIFLGFGFLERNFQRLGLDLGRGGIRYFASAMDLAQRERSTIEELFGQRRVHLGGTRSDCLSFLKETVKP